MAEELKVIITADDKASSVLGGLGGALGSLASLAGAGLAAGAAAGATAVVGLGAAAFSAGQELDAAFDAIAVGTGASGAELEGLKESFRSVFSTVPTDAGTAAGVIGELNTRLGVTGDELEGLARPLLEASRLMGGDATSNTRLFTRVLGDWGIAAEDGATTLDTLFVASQETGIGLDRLMGTVVQFGAPLRAMGFSFEESAAMLGKWEKEGVNSELVLGSLRIAMGNFARDNIPMREGLDATIAKIQELGPGAEATALAMDVFGARAGPDMAAAILEGRFEIDELVASLGEAEGAVMDTAAETADFGEKWQTTMNRAKLALEPVGLAMMDVVGIVLDELQPVLDELLPILTELGAQAAPLIVDAFREFFGLMRDYGLPALREIWAALGDMAAALGLAEAEVDPLRLGIDLLRGVLGGVVAGIFAAKFVIEGLAGALRTLRNWLNQVYQGWLDFKFIVGQATSAIPKWLIPGSPTPFEIGLHGIAGAMDEVNRAGLGGLAPAAVAGGAGAAGGAFQFVYAPQMSLATEREIREVLRPALDAWWADARRRRV